MSATRHEASRRLPSFSLSGAEHTQDSANFNYGDEAELRNGAGQCLVAILMHYHLANNHLSYLKSMILLA